MFKSIVLSAFGAGLAVCVVVSLLQLFTTEPLIIHAEVFESGGEQHHNHGHDALPSGDDSDSIATADHHEDETWAPADGFERSAYTVLANLVIGVAVSLMLLGGMLLRGDPIDARRGLLWGIAGFAAVSLLPALGLPPELPGTPAADLIDRQTWWLTTAVASAAGIGLLTFGQHWGLKAAGVVLLIAPQIIGAPPPPSHEAAYPAGLAGEFVIASVVVSAVLWSLSGLTAGWLHRRLSAAA